MESKEPDASSPSTRWWCKDTIVVVTGANQGIGYALVKRFAVLGLTVVLTARDPTKGLRAVASLRAEGLHVDFCHLDVADPASIKAFAASLRDAYGVVDILVNNAAVSFNQINQNSVEHAETVIKTNFYGVKLLTDALLPLFRRSASASRILNISSRLGLLNKVTNQSVRKMLLDEERLSEEKIDGMVDQFLSDVQSGKWQEGGWPKVWTDYAVSKLALNAYTRLLAKQQQGRGISVNCFCPGFTKTAMTNGQGNYTTDAVAVLASRVALLPPDELPTGKFFSGVISSSYSKL
ncbi:(+)-neomenthol dehydrogenase-like [Aristolochia californica]|uniref:(+)-neomenthol dehydrogenase-like n=1 Tax=Aristolochia californica TaxID=171875 RepID=UPI0035E0D839